MHLALPNRSIPRFCFSCSQHSTLNHQLAAHEADLRTERLLIREYVEEDVESFFRLNSDPKVLRFVPDKALLNVEQARQLLVVCDVRNDSRA